MINHQSQHNSYSLSVDARYMLQIESVTHPAPIQQ